MDIIIVIALLLFIGWLTVKVLSIGLWFTLDDVNKTIGQVILLLAFGAVASYYLVQQAYIYLVNH